MCFINECDWYAETVIDEERPAEKPLKCYECHRAVPTGETMRHVDMWESETCKHNPSHDDYEGPEMDSEECPEGCEHDFGESFSCSICQECAKLLKAIEASEIEEGCHALTPARNEVVCGRPFEGMVLVKYVDGAEEVLTFDVSQLERID